MEKLLGGAAWEVGFHVADCMINKRPITWQGVGISALKGAITGVAFGAVGKAVSGSMSATTRLANYSRKAVQTQRAVRTARAVKRAAPVVKKVAQGVCFIAGTLVLTEHGKIPIAVCPECHSKIHT